MHLEMCTSRCHTNWLIVGCSQPVVIALMVAIASNPPDAPRQCPIIDCGERQPLEIEIFNIYKHHPSLQLTSME